MHAIAHKSSQHLCIHLQKVLIRNWVDYCQHTQKHLLYIIKAQGLALLIKQKMQEREEFPGGEGVGSFGLPVVTARNKRTFYICRINYQKVQWKESNVLTLKYLTVGEKNTWKWHTDLALRSSFTPTSQRGPFLIQSGLPPWTQDCYTRATQ